MNAVSWVLVSHIINLKMTLVMTRMDYAQAT